LLSFAALAQQAPQPDPRLSGPMIQALQSQLALQSAMMRANAEDAEAQRVKLCAAIADDKRDGILECAAKRAEK